MSHTYLPDVLLRLTGASWPVDDGLPLGAARVGTLSVEREIVASTLPGQFRGVSGFSIGNANVTVRQASGRPLAPWAAPDRRVTTGHPAELVAVDLATGTTEPLGAWQVKTPSGALSSAQVGIELAEAQFAGRGTPARLPVVGGTEFGDRPVDPIWIVDELARQAGFHSSPRSVGPGTVAIRSYCGEGAETYSMVTGVPGIASPPTQALALAWFGEGAALVITANVAGTVVFRVDDVDDVGRWLDVRIRPSGVSLSWSGGAWSTEQPITRGLDANWPTRVQVRVTSAISSPHTTWTAVGRSAGDAPWSAATSTGALAGASMDEVTFQVSVPTLDGGLSAVEVTKGDTDPGPRVWTPPTAVLSLLDAVVPAPWLPGAPDVWTGIQSVCGAFAGAAWVDRHGVLTAVSRHELAGSGRPKTPIDVDVMAEDIAWSLDADDYADRLEVTWYPVTWPEADDPVIEWATDDRVRVPAGGSARVRIDMDRYVPVLMGWAHVDEALGDESTWDANTASDGSGLVVSAGVSVASERLTPSLVLVTVTNATAADVWMVDTDGNPALVLRGFGGTVQDAPQVIEHGAPAVDAAFPLQVDLTRLVQDRDTAEALAAFIWARTSRPRWRAAGVRLPLDWSRDLGDILALDHPGSGLSVHALVTRVRLDGSPGEIRQTCDLVLLPPTYADFAAAWAVNGGTYADFAAVWAGLTWPAFEIDPLRVT